MNKKIILLDLDQTLISSEATEDHDFKINKKKSEKFVFHNMNNNNMDSYYIVYERPGLQKFLDFAFENFIVSIWTAASKDYALFIIDKIILQNNDKRKIDYIFFSYHCDISKSIFENSKDLRTISDIFNIKEYETNKVVIIDDYYKDVYKCQPNNCIIAVPFEFTETDSDKDTFLLDIIPQLKLWNNNEKSIKIINEETKNIERNKKLIHKYK